MRQEKTSPELCLNFMIFVTHNGDVSPQTLFLCSLVLYIITFEFLQFLPCPIIDHRPFFRASILSFPL